MDRIGWKSGDWESGRNWDRDRADSFAVSLGVSAAELKAREEKIREEVNSAIYLDPRFDSGFKKLLGTEDALKSFLNGVLAPIRIVRIENLHFQNVELNVYTPERLQLRMDIRAETDDGTHVDIEMQKAPVAFIRERILLQESAFVCVAKKAYDREVYARFPGESAEDRAMRERLRYDIPYTFSIWICDFNINGPEKKRYAQTTPGGSTANENAPAANGNATVKGNAPAANENATADDGKDYHDSWHVYSDAEIKKGKALPVSEKIKYILIDLGKFNKRFEELENDEERWLYLLKNAGGATEELPKFNDAALDDAIARIRVVDTDNETKEAQVACRMSVEEEIGRIAMAFVDGKKEEREKANAEIAAKDKEIAANKAEIAANKAEIAAKKAEIAAKDEEIRKLKEQLAQKR